MGRPYLDWLPYKDQTIPRARNYFNDGKPFTLLTPSQESNLDDYCTIRNALAHKSDSARTKFQRLISGLPLLPHEKSPAGYLRSRPYSMSKQTQYEIAVLELANIANVICSCPLQADATLRLGRLQYVLHKKPECAIMNC